MKREINSNSTKSKSQESKKLAFSQTSNGNRFEYLSVKYYKIKDLFFYFLTNKEHLKKARGFVFQQVFYKLCNLFYQNERLFHKMLIFLWLQSYIVDQIIIFAKCLD